MACGTWAPGRLNAAREVLRFGFGLRLGLASAGRGLPLVRQLGEANARPSGRTFWKGDLVGAMQGISLIPICYDLTYSAAPADWGFLDRPSAVCESKLQHQNAVKFSYWVNLLSERLIAVQWEKWVCRQFAPPTFFLFVDANSAKTWSTGEYLRRFIFSPLHFSMQCHWVQFDLSLLYVQQSIMTIDVSPSSTSPALLWWSNLFTQTCSESQCGLKIVPTAIWSSFSLNFFDTLSDHC